MLNNDPLIDNSMIINEEREGELYPVSDDNLQRSIPNAKGFHKTQQLKERPLKKSVDINSNRRMTTGNN